MKRTLLALAIPFILLGIVAQALYIWPTVVLAVAREYNNIGQRGAAAVAIVLGFLSWPLAGLVIPTQLLREAISKVRS